MLDLTQTLLDATTTFCTALAPTAPLLQHTVNWAWVIVAASHGLQRQALRTAVGMGQDTASQLLLTRSTFLCAFLWIPLRNLAILEECRVSTSLHFVELASNLLQCAQLSLEVNVVITTSLHLFLQIAVKLLVLCSCLPCNLTGIGFLLGCLSEFCLRITKHVL